MSSTVTKSHDWANWVLYASSYQITYNGNATMTVTRANGADTITGTINASFCAPSGDDTSWYLQIKTSTDGSTWTTHTPVQISEESSSPKHPAGYSYTATNTFTVNVGTSAGTLYTQVYMYVDGFTSYSGGSSEVWSETFSYTNKGCSTISSLASTVTFSDASTASTFTINIANYLTSAQIHHYNLKVYCLEHSSSSHIYSQSNITGIQTSYTGTFDNSTTGYGQKAILTACSATSTPTLRFRLETFSSASTSVGVSWFDSKGLITKSCGGITTSLTVDYTTKCGSTGITGAKPIVSGSSTASGLGCYITGYYFLIYDGSGKEVYRSSTKYVTGTQSLTIPTQTLDYTLASGSYSIRVCKIDSRGYYNYSAHSATVTAWTAPVPKIRISCVGTTATVYCTWSTTQIGSSNTPQFTVYAKRVSDGMIIYYDVLDPETVQEEAVWYAVTNTSLTDPGYTGGHHFTDSEQLKDLDTETYEFTLVMYDTVTTSSTVIVATTSSGMITMSALRGGNGVRFFGEAQSSDDEFSDVGAVTCYGRSGACGFRVFEPKEKDTDYNINTWLSTASNTLNMDRGLWDVSEDGVPTKANWWCWISDNGHINLSNTDNADNRNIYLNSNNIYGKVDGTNYKLDWIYTAETVDGWYCRKHTNGIWECTQDISKTGTISTAWGNMYRLQLGSLTLPVTLSSLGKLIECTITRIDSNDAWCMVAEETGATVSRTPIWELLRPNSSSTSYTYKYRVKIIINTV